ncbi:MAG: hypothetical protein SGPRY_009011 [Prymnesium sp.]
MRSRDGYLSTFASRRAAPLDKHSHSVSDRAVSSVIAGFTEEGRMGQSSSNDLVPFERSTKTKRQRKGDILKWDGEIIIIGVHQSPAGQLMWKES